MYKELSNKLKEKIGRKVGVSKGVLKRNGYIDRTKVPGYKPFYFLTPKARELIGAPAPEAPTTAAEKALEVLKK
jgi:DNA-binding MarR family transcriptional regulator